MRYRIIHKTSYSCREPISVGHNQAWLQPRNLPGQTCDSFDLRITPTPSVLTNRLDTYGNTVHTFSFNEGYRSLDVIATSRLDVTPTQTGMPKTQPWEAVRAGLREHQSAAEVDAGQFQFASPLVSLFEQAADYTRTSFTSGQPIADCTADLMSRIFDEFTFDPTATTVSTPVAQVFEQRRGVCQDFAHLMLAMVRSQGLAARYVSGYLRTQPPPGKPRLVGADASHAWVSVFCGPDVGWIDFDPTNNMVPGGEHITIGWGRDYSDIPPLRGVFLGGGAPHLRVSVDVEILSSP